MSIRTGPQDTTVILPERVETYVVAQDSSRVVRSERGKRHAIKAHQPFACSYPEVAVARLEHRLDGLLPDVTSGGPAAYQQVANQGVGSGGAQQDQKEKRKRPLNPGHAENSLCSCRSRNCLIHARHSDCPAPCSKSPYSRTKSARVIGTTVTCSRRVAQLGVQHRI